MKAKTCLALAIAAGCASVASANPEKITLTNQQAMSSSNVGHIYYNMATGEMTKIAPHQERGADDSAPVWINEMYIQCPDQGWYYTPIRDSATGEDSHWMDWGDITPNSVIDAITFLYASSVMDPEEDGEEGFEMDVTFAEAVDINELNSAVGDLQYYGVTVTGIPGSADGAAAGWLITVDLSGGNEFEIGDIDGVDDTPGQTGNTSGGAGADLDTYPGADFSYGFNFRHPGEDLAGVTGCGLVSPPEQVEPNSLGDDDVMAIYDGGWEVFLGFFWFNGFNCDIDPYQPWGSYYIGLYGPNGEGPCSPADINNEGAGDGVLDFFDVLQFLGWFDAMDDRADFIDDNTFDFFDVLEFLGIFDAGGCD